MANDVRSLRQELKARRRCLRELYAQARGIQLQIFNHENIDEIRRALSEHLMVERRMHQERDVLVARRIEELKQELKRIERSATLANAADAEKLVGVRQRSGQLVAAVAALRVELDKEVSHEQQEVQRILAQFEVEQREFEACQSACAELEKQLEAVGCQEPPPLPRSFTDIGD